MFETLSERLSGSLAKIGGGATLNEDNIKDTLREVRMALLEADVALPVARDFVKKVKEEALGREILKELRPHEAFVKIVFDALTEMMGSENQGLNLTGKPPQIYLMAGLQGAGKTTTTAKLAKFLIERQKKKVMVVSADVYRPAAIKQLETVAGQAGAMFHPSSADQRPLDIARSALQAAKIQFCDVLIVDTAGRLHVDVDMMDEITELERELSPSEVLFVVDSMTGQDAANTAKAFGEALPLTGVILTKTDGDARGGAALSVKAITGKPIKFLGQGEKIEALEPFHPERVAQRILGMGDVLSLVEEVERKIDKEASEKMAKKMASGGNFDFEDMLTQFKQMQKLGGMAGFLDKLPGMNTGQMKDALAKANPEAQIKHMESIIQSMTVKERRNPHIINPSRKRRIAEGSGKTLQDVNRVLKQQSQMSKMMKKFASPKGMAKMMRNLGSMGLGGMGGMGGGGAGGLPGLGGPTSGSGGGHGPLFGGPTSGTNGQKKK